MARILKKTHENIDFPGTVKINIGKGMFAIVDGDLFCELLQYRWKAVKSKACWYAIARKIKDGKTTTIRMHRFVAQTPLGQDCHHINSITLDNRRKNLLNLSPADHKAIHGN